VPDEGRARHDLYRIEPPKTQPDYPALPWICERATMLNVYFEVRKEVLLDRLPPEFCRSTPAYCRVVVFDVPESPVGPFREAFIALGCRLNMMPAGFAAVSITNNAKVLSAGLCERGFPTGLGKIDFEIDVTHARALIADDKGPVMEVVMPLLQTIEPSRLAYDHVDAIRTKPDGSTELVVTGHELKIERAAICKSTRIEYPDERESIWQTLNCRNVVSAQVATGTRTFAAAKPIQ
jgi:Acetoacetate decarboxylase (ADC)